MPVRGENRGRTTQPAIFPMHIIARTLRPSQIFLLDRPTNSTDRNTSFLLANTHRKSFPCPPSPRRQSRRAKAKRNKYARGHILCLVYSPLARYFRDFVTSLRTVSHYLLYLVSPTSHNLADSCMQPRTKAPCGYSARRIYSITYLLCHEGNSENSAHILS